jgi:uncharacterized membrane-anchored protein
VRPSASDLAAARALFKDSVSLYQAADYVGARAKLDACMRLAPRGAVAWNLATVEERLGQRDEARALLVQVCGDAEAKGDALQAARARDELRAIDARRP